MKGKGKPKGKKMMPMGKKMGSSGEPKPMPGSKKMKGKAAY